MLGKNLPLSYFVHDPKICDAPFLGIPQLGHIGDLHIDTIGLALTSMVIILVTAAFITPKLTEENAGSTGQTLLELFYQFIRDLTEGQMGHAYKKFFPLIAAIFIFVLVSNFLGVGPWKIFESFSWWPQIGHNHHNHKEAFELASPTTDFNVTFGLATISLIAYLFSGFWAHQWKYFKLFLLNPIEWLDVVVRPATLALRLMIVVGADELLRSASLAIAPVLIPIPVMGLELFVGIIQAFVFALLTTIYIGMTIAHH